MSDRLFRGLLWYAVAKGVWRGLHRPSGVTADQMSFLIRDLYVDSVKSFLNQPALLLFDTMSYDTKKGDE